MSSNYLDQIFSLKGRVAVVIGGTGELCGAMAEGLAGAGAEVVLVGRNEEKAKNRLRSIEQQGGRAWFHSADATSRASLEALCTAVIDRSGRVDIVVNGAGTNSARPFLEISEEEFSRILDTNLKSIFLSCQVFGKTTPAAGSRRLYYQHGIDVRADPLSRVFTYSASKAAVHNLSKNLAREWAPQRVRVNLLVPGFFPAEQNRQVLTPDRVNSIMGHTPMKRFGEARELIGATLLLASDAAGGFITGAELVVDGGYHAMTI